MDGLTRAMVGTMGDMLMDQTMIVKSGTFVARKMRMI